ncbi:uncharacterized protein LOC127796468 [Diospyros lotus]|uniref:uncharacterized protein LOC127796468 n=1 Tax=Diospyros lotus TaxID=55363 RepID=UPI00225A64E3|nr:uncharacterized protein LOC127796468 [Diospyros lotus]
MGRDWFYWGGGGKAAKGGGGGAQRDEPPSGCMAAVFQIFDFRQFQFALHQQVPSFKTDSFLPEESDDVLKGVEAPRNSLEMEAASFPSTLKEKEEITLDIPMGIQIKTSGGTVRSKDGASRARTDHDLSSEYSSSPGAKTPNLVARLMGLDLLPETPSPCSSSSLKNFPSNPYLQCPKQLVQKRQRSSSATFEYNDIIGSRSLPETPRISSARRSDVDHHRLSLQINKENFHMGGSEAYSDFYARQIVKQVKESVSSRKAGLDITNTMTRNRDYGPDHAVLLKSKKGSKNSVKVISDEARPTSKQSTPSCSPRLRFHELKNEPGPAIKDQLSGHSPKLSPSPLSSSSVDVQSQSGKVSSALVEQKKMQRYQPNPDQVKARKSMATLKRNKQEEPFVRPSTTGRASLSEKKCKKTPLSSELLNVNGPTLFPARKDSSSSSTKVAQNQVQKQAEASETLSSKRSTQLSCCASQRTYAKQEASLTPPTTCGDSSNGATTSCGEEFHYISKILKRAGFINTPLSFSKWYSPSHPLDPSIFQHLELFSPAAEAGNSPLTHRCNRKLIFHLADEILAQILKPNYMQKPWVYYNHHILGSELIQKLCSRIKSFPSVNCQVLEDIDGLIEKDLCRSELQGYSSMAPWEDESEAIVAGVVGGIVESLVVETAVEFAQESWGAMNNLIIM